ncbi:MAG: helix-turn-helix domain-containing protein [Chloroflexi bacterium]|nr:helix-turn-helix domain-containing protein [Chloroflexota bacterium]
MPEMLTAKDVQSLLQVDRSTVYRMAEAQRLPAVKVGRQWRFPADQIQNWLVKQANPLALMPDVTENSRVSPLPLIEELPLTCVQLIQDTFADSMGIMMIMADMNGRPVTEVSNSCGLFSATMPQAMDKCTQQWQQMATTIDLEPKYIVSHLQLLCTRGLIRQGTQLRGMVFAGGIAPQNWPPTPETIQKIAADLSVPTAVVADHITEVYYLDSDQQNHILSLVQRVADIVSHILNERRQLLSKLEAIADLTTVTN